MYRCTFLIINVVPDHRPAATVTSGPRWSRDRNDNNKGNIADSNWSVLLSINATAHFDWLLNSSHSSVNLAHRATSGFDLSGTAALHQRWQTIHTDFVRSQIELWRNKGYSTGKVWKACGSCHEQCYHSRPTTHRLAGRACPSWASGLALIVNIS